MLVGLLALMMAALFTGAAFYINFAEHPARVLLPPAMARDQWEPAYRRGFIMQSSLAVLGGMSGLAAWWSTSQILYFAGAITLLINWPYTLLAIMPVNNRLLAKGASDTDIIALLARWNRLHAGRTLLGVLSIIFFLSALVDLL